jgi:anti-sigma B factor antagonist
MTCSRCGLSLRLRGVRLRLDRCPRCFAFAGVSVPLQKGDLSVLLGGAAEGRLPPRRGDQASFGHLVVCTEHAGEFTSVTLQGKLDIASERCFEQALRRAWDMGCERMVIDLSELEFIDAVGVKALLRARQYALELGHQLCLMRGPPNVHRMFELTGTLDLFTFRD